MAEEKEKPDHVKMLEAMLAEHEKMLRDAFDVVNREEPIVSSLKAALLALTGTAAHPASTTPVRSGGAEISPQKKLEYRELTLVGAMERAINKLVPPGEAVHADSIVREIYTPIPDNKTFIRLKRNCVSELVRKKDVFVRGNKPNTFKLVAKPQSMAA